MPELMLTGSIRLFFLYDVAEAIRLADVRPRMDESGAQGPPFRSSRREFAAIARPPVEEPVPSIRTDTGEEFQARLSYFEWGVVSLELILPWSGFWRDLESTALRSISNADIEGRAEQFLKGHLEQRRAAFDRPYSNWLSEDYAVVQIDSVVSLSAAELLSQRGPAIARMVRVEPGDLSIEEQSEVLQSRLSYSPTDLLVAAWTATFLYDTPAGAASTLELIEYANTQLLNLRHYDERLTAELARVYDGLGKRRDLLARWRLVREAERLNRTLLEVRELNERMDNAVKFLSDMFAARVYRLVAARVGVADYRRLVEDKLRTAGELYHFMVDQFHHGRAFVLELMVVIILIIDLYLLLAGNH
ncbi:MAG: hypothetical protein R2729_01570 [Bryobacteraceae bacterium]